MTRARQQRQSEEVRTRIVETARRIIAEEGIEALSIRRVTREMGYSAGIVYHYFQNKEDLLQCVMQAGYKRILAALEPPDSGLPPDKAIRASFTRYIEGALQWPEEYRAFMLSASPQILAFTSVLGEDDCEKRPALMGLVSALTAGVDAGLFTPCDPRVTAQALWSAAFGLVIRLLTEKDVSPAHRARIMERQLDILMKGLMK